MQELCAERNDECASIPGPIRPVDDRAFSAAGAPVVSLGTSRTLSAPTRCGWPSTAARTTAWRKAFVPRGVPVCIHSTDGQADLILKAWTVALRLVIADLCLAVGQAAGTTRPRPTPMRRLKPCNRPAAKFWIDQGRGWTARSRVCDARNRISAVKASWGTALGRLPAGHVLPPFLLSGRLRCRPWIALRSCRKTCSKGFRPCSSSGRPRSG